MCASLFPFLFHHVVCVCMCVFIHPCTFSLPIKLAAACLSVHIAVCICVCVSLCTLQGQVNQCYASDFSGESSSCPWRSRQSHPDRASFCPPRIKLFHWDVHCRWPGGWKPGTHYMHAKCHRNKKKMIKLSVAHGDLAVFLLTSFFSMPLYPYQFYDCNYT